MKKVSGQLETVVFTLTVQYFINWVMEPCRLTVMFPCDEQVDVELQYIVYVSGEKKKNSGLHMAHFTTYSPKLIYPSSMLGEGPGNQMTRGLDRDPNWGPDMGPEWGHDGKSPFCTISENKILLV